MPVQIPVKTLIKLGYNPFSNCPWGCKVTKANVTAALKANRLVAIPDETWAADSIRHGKPSPVYHEERIAYLVKNGWNDPIQIDVGIPSMNCHVDWMVIDGNHRVAAAIMRGDTTISAQVGGSIDYAQELFGMDVSENFEESSK